MTDYLKELHNDMQTFAQRNGVDIYKVYTSLGDYIAGWMDVTGKPVEGWTFTAEQNKCFHSMLRKVIQAAGTAMIADSWRPVWRHLHGISWQQGHARPVLHT